MRTSTDLLIYLREMMALVAFYKESTPDGEVINDNDHRKFHRCLFIQLTTTVVK